MDLITQGVLGAAVGMVGWRHKMGRPAILAGACFGLLPDLDVVAGVAGQWASLVHHRGISHALIFAPVMAWPLGAIAWKAASAWRTKRPGLESGFLSWVHLAFWAMWTHPLLDAFTSYGTQLYLPFSSTRVAWDGVSIIDPLYTFPLIAALIASWLWRTHPTRGRMITAAALAWTVLYLGFGVWQNHRAITWARTQFQQTFKRPASHMRALPMLANLFSWRIVARDEQLNVYAAQHSSLAPKQLTFYTMTPPTAQLGALDPRITQAHNDPRGEIFLWFADDYVSYDFFPHEQGTRLRMSDQRYGGVQRPTHAMWGAEAIFDKEGKLKDIQRYNDRSGMDIGAEFGGLWSLIWTGSVRSTQDPHKAHHASPPKHRAD